MASSSSSATTLSSSILISQSEKAFIRSGCRDDCRLDGRKRHEFTTYTLTSNATPSSCTATTTTLSFCPETLYFSNGSARLLATTADPITNSHLQILCSVKADVVRPAPDQPHCGLIELHVDSLLLLSSSPQSSRSSSNKKLEQLQAALQQLVCHDSDYSSLCLVRGEYVWRLSIDLLLMPAVDATTSTGRLLDACSHVLRAALQCTKLPAIQVVVPATNTATVNDSRGGTSSHRHELVVDSDVHHCHTPLLYQQVPVIVTVTVIPTIITPKNMASGITTPVLLLDATAAEEASAMAVVHVAFVREPPHPGNNHHNNNGNPPNKNHSPNFSVCGIRLQGSLPAACLPECIAVANEALQDGRIDRAYRPCQTFENNKHAFLPPLILLQ